MIFRFDRYDRDFDLQRKTAYQWILEWCLTSSDILQTAGISEDAIKSLMNDGLITHVENSPRIFKISNLNNVQSHYQENLLNLLNSRILQKRCFDMQRGLLQMMPRFDLNEFVVNFDRQKLSALTGDAHPVTDFFVFSDKKELNYAPIAVVFVDSMNADRYQFLVESFNYRNSKDFISSVFFLYAADDIFNHFRHIMKSKTKYGCIAKHVFIFSKTDEVPITIENGHSKKSWLTKEKAREYREKKEEEEEERRQKLRDKRYQKQLDLQKQNDLERQMEEEKEKIRLAEIEANKSFAEKYWLAIEELLDELAKSCFRLMKIFGNALTAIANTIMLMVAPMAPFFLLFLLFCSLLLFLKFF